MDRDSEPKTDEELARRLRVLYDAAEHSGGARDDFWDTVSYHIGWIVDLVERGSRKTKRSAAGQIGGRARMAALTPERRKEIAQKAANARWHSNGQ